MAKAVGLHDEPRRKSGLSEFPKFIIRTVRINYGRTDKWKALWHCKCGATFESLTCNVTRGHTKSCGCDQVAARQMKYPTHGHFLNGKPSATYKSWQSMIARCTNPKHPAFEKYAGRGITICAQWLSSFEQFLADVGDRPDGMTLDRVDTMGNYEPGNVRWATAAQQGRNRRNARLVMVNGNAVRLSDLHAQTGCIIPYQVVLSRVAKCGWPIDRAMSDPVLIRPSKKS